MENKNKNQTLDFYNGDEDDSEDNNGPDFGLDNDNNEGNIDLDKDDEEKDESDLFVEEDEEEEEEEDEEGEEDEDDAFMEEDEDGVVISKTKIALMKKLLTNIQESNEKLINFLGGSLDEEDEERINISQISEDIVSPEEDEESGKVVEGVFDGEHMIGPDGKQYSVPSNYASKSKLVEGDLLKLTITPKGTFVYKQTKPAERKRLKGKLEKNDAGNFVVKADGKHWKVLTSSITYFKGNAGDEVVLLVPKYSNGGWGAVENIIKSK